MKKRVIALLLCAAVMVGLFPALSMTASAYEKVYINEKNFPDDSFRSYLLDVYFRDIKLKDEKGWFLSRATFETFQTMDVSEYPIEDLTGIEYFTGLTTLDCSENVLTYLDLSKNTALTYLDCDYNRLTRLVFGENSALEYLSCGWNNLTALDLSHCTKLKELSCTYSQLTSLNVSRNVDLELLDCCLNLLRELDVSQNTKLEQLNCYGNQLSTLDVSKNIALQKLDCKNNGLVALDLSYNPALDEIYCYGQKIPTVYVVEKNGEYELDMNEVVGSDNLGKVHFDPSVNYNKTTGIVTFKTVPKTVAYDYDVFYEDVQMGVTAKLFVGEKIYINEVNFPDTIFRTYLTDSLLRSVKHEDAIGIYVSEADAKAIKEIDVSGRDIIDLKGIEYFTGLTSLNCAFNQLRELNVSENTALKELICPFNQLTVLDVSNNIQLVELYCNNNRFATLDLSNNPVLIDMSYSGQKTSADYVRKNGVYELNMGKVVGSENLEKVTFDGTVNYDPATGIVTFDTQPETVTYSYFIGNDKKPMEVTVTLSEGTTEELGDTLPVDEKIYVNEENFPDAGFRSYLTDELLVSRLQEDENGKFVLKTDAEAVRTIDVNERGISELTGIEYFTGLTSLYCTHNQLTELDVSKNTALKVLTCASNQLTELDVTANTALKSLRFPNNKLVMVDLSKNTQLQYLVCSSNQLSALDLSANIALVDLYCGSNQLEALDVGNNTALLSLDCSSNQLSELDVSKNTVLAYFYCASNQLSELDLSKNAALEYFYCASNHLTVLDLSNNTALVDLDCSSNQLATLDLSNNLSLMNMNCSGQEISSRCAETDGGYELDMNEIVGSENLSKVTLDDSNPDISYDGASGMVSFTTWPVKIPYNYNVGYNDVQMDVMITASEIITPSMDKRRIYINESSFPDDAFRDCMEDIMGDSVQDDEDGEGLYIYESEIQAIEEIDIHGKGISNLTGIEHFTGLKTLDCSGNRIVALSLNDNTALEVLDCSANRLLALDVSGNTALQTLNCQENRLRELNVSNSTALRELYCNSNQLTELNLLQNQSLEELHCNSNQLKELNLFNNSQMTVLDCSNNGLATLDLGRNQEPGFNLPLTDASFSGQKVSASYISIYGTYVLDMAQLVGSENLSRVYFDSDINYNAETGHVSFATQPESVTYNYAVGNWVKRMDVTVSLSENPNVNFDEIIDKDTYDDISAVEKLYINETTFADANFRTYVTGELLADVVKLDGGGTYVYVSEAKAIREINVRSKGISDLKGIEYFTGITSLDCSINLLTALDLGNNTNLETLDCYSNQLGSLEVSKNTALKKLNCSDNQLTALDMSNNTALEVLYCFSNQLTVLDVSKNVELIDLDCDRNQLTELDLSNNAKLATLYCGSNSLAVLDLGNNPSLNEVYCSTQGISAEYVKKNGVYELDMNKVVGSENLSKVTFTPSVNYSASTGIVTFETAPESISYDYNTGYEWMQVDVLLTLSESTGDVSDNNDKILINEANFPDANFRDYLIGTLLKSVLRYDIREGVYVFKSDVEAIEEIEAYNRNISNLKGIEFFTELTYLNCSGNLLAALDLSNNTALELLNCSGNQLTTLNLSQNTALKQLYCSSNQLTELDLSNNTALDSLGCLDNQLTELELSALSKLVYLDCGYNNLTALDLSYNPSLEHMYCGNNQLTSLDLSGNSNLQSVMAQGESASTKVGYSVEVVGGAIYLIYLSTLDASLDITKVDRVVVLTEDYAQQEAVYDEALSAWRCTEKPVRVTYYYDVNVPGQTVLMDVTAETVEVEGGAHTHSLIYTNNGENHTVSCANCNYSATWDHEYVDGVCICGAEEGLIAASDLVFRNKTLSLQSYIAFNITARNSVLQNYDSWYVIFERYDQLSGAVVAEYVEGVDYGTSYQLFEYKVSSYMMSDVFTATLYAVKDGVTYKGEVYADSVENFVISRMEAAAASSADLATLYANLLTYGSKAQTFLSYNTSALADDSLGAYASYVTTAAPTAENLYAETSKGLTGATKNKLALGISSAVQIQLRINLDASYDVNTVYGELTYTRGSETITQRIDGKDFTKSGSRYVLIFDAITAVDGRAPVQITIYDGNGNAISETWTYSISSYLVDGGLSGNGLATMEALLNYFDAAAKVFG